MSGIYQDEKAPLWLHIMGGILGAVVVLLLAWKGYERYQEYKVERAIIEYKAKLHADQRAILREKQRQQKVQQYNSPECSFWRNHYQNNMTPQNLNKVREYCPRQ